jgi:SAM-dependent methyltransferase
MQFDDATSRRVEETYSTPDVVEQRRVVRAALGLQAGQNVLDIGSGPGFLACEMAEAVGPSGSVRGIDPSEAGQLSRFGRLWRVHRCRSHRRLRFCLLVTSGQQQVRRAPCGTALLPRTAAAG